MTAEAAAASIGDMGRRYRDLPWLYLDSVGQEYGPVPGWAMREWLTEGRFPVGGALRVRLPEWEKHLPLLRLFPDLASAFNMPPAWPDMYSDGVVANGNGRASANEHSLDPSQQLQRGRAPGGTGGAVRQGGGADRGLSLGNVYRESRAAAGLAGWPLNGHNGHIDERHLSYSSDSWPATGPQQHQGPLPAPQQALPQHHQHQQPNQDHSRQATQCTPPPASALPRNSRLFESASAPLDNSVNGRTDNQRPGETQAISWLLHDSSEKTDAGRHVNGHQRNGVCAPSPFDDDRVTQRYASESLAKLAEEHHAHHGNLINGHAHHHGQHLTNGHDDHWENGRGGQLAFSGLLQ